MTCSPFWFLFEVVAGIGSAVMVLVLAWLALERIANEIRWALIRRAEKKKRGKR